jgi:hypothetical protein
MIHQHKLRARGLITMQLSRTGDGTAMPSEKLHEPRIVMRQHIPHGLFIAMAEVLKLKAIGRASVVFRFSGADGGREPLLRSAHQVRQAAGPRFVGR